MTPPSDGFEPSAVARRLTGSLARRAAREEAVGVVSSWQHCDTTQARNDLVARGRLDGQDAEVARVVAIIDAVADGRGDPDWDE
ncbi:hypothetical protein [Actinophytocola glycyrrhizae]|uniref:hypothetical protein n=1 Tax=Actinophytocola glycyrrhizae TaxID=2044873 RepID=UPI00366AE546